MTTRGEHCGTDRGYGIHRRRGEKTCAACRAAHSEAASRTRSAIRAVARAEVVVKPRRPTRKERDAARIAALEKLAKIHSTTFRYLYSEELHARKILSTQAFKRVGGVV